MGYRSEVAYVIAFKSTEDRDRLLARLPDDVVARLLDPDDGVTLTPTQIRFHEEDTKWYPSYFSVQDHLLLLEVAKEPHWEGDDGYVSSVGVFARIGEDWSDIEYETWSDARDGLPYPWDLLDIERSMSIRWE